MSADSASPRAVLAAESPETAAAAAADQVREQEDNAVTTSRADVENDDTKDVETGRASIPPVAVAGSPTVVLEEGDKEENADAVSVKETVATVDRDHSDSTATAPIIIHEDRAVPLNDDDDDSADLENGLASSTRNVVGTRDHSTLYQQHVVVDDDDKLGLAIEIGTERTPSNISANKRYDAAAAVESGRTRTTLHINDINTNTDDSSSSSSPSSSSSATSLSNEDFDLSYVLSLLPSDERLIHTQQLARSSGGAATTNTDTPPYQASNNLMEDAYDNALENNSITSGPLPPGGATTNAGDDDMDEPHLPPTFYEHPIRIFCCCWPFLFFLPMILLFIVLFLVFCVFPFTLFLIMATVLYYCCTKDPISPGLLWTAIWQDDLLPGTAPGMTNHTPETVYTPEQIKALLIRRTLMERIPHDQVPMHLQHNHNNVTNDEADLYHIVKTASEQLVFKTVVMTDPILVTNSNNVDDKNNDLSSTFIASPASHYYRQSPPSQRSPTDHNNANFDSNNEHGSPEHDIDDNSSNNREREVACDICLLEYETADVVAWSRNPACDHAYHETCIADWLLRKSTCPSCRQDYLKDPNADDDDDNKEPPPTPAVPRI